MLIKLKPDWSNWIIYEDATLAYLRSKGFGGHIMFSSEDYLRSKGPGGYNISINEGPKIGTAGSPQREIFIQYLASDGMAVLVLIETLPASIYEKIAGEQRFGRKWGQLRRLYEARQGTVVNVAAKATKEVLGVPVLGSLQLGGGLDGAQYDGVGASGPDGDGDGAGESFTEEQSVIMNQLKRFKFTHHTDSGGDMSLFTHLTMLKVLREALVNRDIVISDVEFLECVAGSFGDESTYGDYVKAVVGRMRKAELEVAIGGGATHRSEVGEVFEMLLELEKLSRAKVVAA